jgi:hypothetical protein
MSKKDAPNFIEIEPAKRCSTCFHAYYDQYEDYFCNKYLFMINADGDFNVCNSWEYDNEPIHNRV